MHSLSEENYLKSIFNLSQTGNKITPTAIAEALGNNPASVVDMLKKLVEKKLVQYDKGKGARLTESGLRTALDIVRKHRLWEVFLKEKLGYSWEEVHDMAEQLEHIHHPNLADRLDKFLGFPEYDPHGDPIPQANGKMAKAFKTTLAEVEPKQQCRVVAVKDTGVSFLQYLKRLGIDIGSRINVVERIEFDDSIVIQIEKDLKTTVSRKFAESILVR
ncbi:MAG: metal-dependent transcriptional regulator [Bacteroidetes bacterium]|nr:metal-dependent transcriptional regulator [Bacteroidota bacterium]